MGLRRRSIVALAMGALAVACAGMAHAQCTYPALLSGAAATATGGTGTKTTYQFTQSNVFWTAVGVRPDAGSDWDVGIYQSTAAFPTCVATLLGNSTRGSGVDFVVGDFNHNPTGAYYVAASHFSGSGNGKVQWDDGPDLLTVNAPVVQQSTDATNVLQVWDVYLVQDSTYSFEFSHTGAADTHLLLFHNAGGGTLWEGRNAAEFDVVNSTQYQAPTTGYYGVVVVNDNGGTGTFGVQVGECLPPIDLYQQQPLVTTGAEGWYDFYHVGGFLGYHWVGAAVRANGGASDWDCELYSNPNGSYPLCLSSPVGSSNQTQPKVDFVIGDFDYNPTGTYYLRAHLYQDIGSGSALVQLQDDLAGIRANDSAFTGSTGPNDVFRLLSLHLEAGTGYTFLFSKTGSANLKLLLFRNPAAGPYWTGRSNSEWEFAGPATVLYTAPTTDDYAVVIVNDDGGTATWSLAVGTCPTPTALTSDKVEGSFLATDYWSFDQQDPYWTVVGTQAGFANDDFDISAYSTASGTGYPTCEGGLLANSQFGQGTVDLVVGDFNHNTPGTYYVNDYAYQLAGSAGHVQWDSGPDLVTVNGPTIWRPVGINSIANYFVEAWDVFLQAGHTYSFRMNQGGVGDWHLLLFRNPGGGTYWAGRSAAAFDMTSGVTYYTAPSTGFYGIVTADNNQADNSFYAFRVDEGMVSVDADAPPTSTGLTGVAPNPTPGGTHLDFALTRPGAVTLDVLDASGRRVASLGGNFAAGRQQLTWDGRDEAGARLPAGLYFVRMRVAGRDVGTRRITLLR
jgi:hypothetical protein